VLEACHGAEALTAAERHAGTIDLLVTDVIMPVMGGAELAARLRRDRPGLRILFVSGYSDSVLSSSLLAGSSLLNKPYGPEALATAVEEALAKEAPAPETPTTSR